jgi:hypothetical protein
MENFNDAFVELKCLILDILAQKKLEGRTEIPVSELLEELGMDENTNLTGLNPLDTIGLSSKTLENVERAKAQIRVGGSTVH